jgi:hypothetical protein
MEQHKALHQANVVFTYFYNEAKHEFGPLVAKKLAQVPADYVYNELMKRKSCYISPECCLEYCNEVLDSDFNKFNPTFKRELYEKANKVISNISQGEINNNLKKLRKASVDKVYLNTVDMYRKKQENELNRMMNDIQLENKENIDVSLKKLKLR